MAEITNAEETLRDWGTGPHLGSMEQGPAGLMKVLVANRPQLLRDCLAASIEREPGLEVVIAGPTETAILRLAQREDAACCIVSLDPGETSPRLCRALFARNPHTLVLAVGRNKLTVYWFEIIVRSTRLNCSMQIILEILRSRSAGEHARLGLPADRSWGPSAKQTELLDPHLTAVLLRLKPS